MHLQVGFVDITDQVQDNTVHGTVPVSFERGIKLDLPEPVTRSTVNQSQASYQNHLGRGFDSYSW